jgi:signal transduction histidine kinase
VFLEADPLRLAQVLTNLLGNAAKFTDLGGHIRLSAEVEGEQVVLRVRDNGRGIAPDRLPLVFDLFHRMPGPATKQTGGLGIGLALVKSLVELHGGSVAAHSDAGAENGTRQLRMEAAKLPRRLRKLNDQVQTANLSHSNCGPRVFANQFA